MKKEEYNSKSSKFIVPFLLVIIIILLIVILFIFTNNKMNKNDYNVGNNYSNDTSTSKQNSSNYIDKNNAIDIALNDAKVDKNSIKDLDIELDYKYNQTVYEISFDYQNYEYEYYINAETGNIIKSFEERD